MSEVEYFLKVLKREGYPSENVNSIADMLSYDLTYFLSDLKRHVGYDTLKTWVQQTLDKLSGKEGIRIDWEEGDYVYVRLYVQEINMVHNCVECEPRWEDSKITITQLDGSIRDYTVEEFIFEFPSSEVSLLGDEIWDTCEKIVHQNCGLNLCKFENIQ